MNEKRRAPLMAAVVGVGLLCAVGAAEAEVFKAGRLADPKRDAGVRVMLSNVLDLRGMVEETRRPYYDATGQPEKQNRAQTFTVDDFNVDSGHPALGFGAEKIWKYVTLQFEASVMNPKSSAKARRNYYIGVDKEIDFEGRGYKNMMIEEGSRFNWEIMGGTMEARWLVTPVTMSLLPELSFTPWFEVGVFSFLGSYKIDNGEPKGVKQYMNPAKEFVVGGSSSGLIGAGVPQIGFGGEVRFGSPEMFNLVIDGSYCFLKYGGSTRYFTTSSHRAKNFDLDHTNYRIRAFGEFPLQSGRAITLGVQYHLVESDVEIRAKEATREEIIARRERFDKNADFKLATAGGFLGITF